MKKFKLIKCYPGSPNLNTIVEVGNLKLGQMVQRHWIYNIGEDKEYWQEVIEKDYEILSFKQTSSGWLWLASGVNQWCREGVIIMPYTTNEILNHSMYYINSVKRLSDGEIFTIGDLVFSKFWNTSGNIIKLELIGNNICYNIKNGNKESCSTLSNLQIIKQQLFITEDGVNIFEGDSVFRVFTNDWIIYEVSNLNISWKHAKVAKSLIFSTREKAEEYILLNKPCLSAKDIIEKLNYIEGDIDDCEDYNISDFKELYNLVKQKLNL